jgi:hypothetical protein
MAVGRRSYGFASFEIRVKGSVCIPSPATFYYQSKTELGVLGFSPTTNDYPPKADFSFFCRPRLKSV